MSEQLMCLLPLKSIPQLIMRGAPCMPRYRPLRWPHTDPTFYCCRDKHDGKAAPTCSTSTLGCSPSCQSPCKIPCMALTGPCVARCTLVLAPDCMPAHPGLHVRARITP
jgi:hypothetical protein